MNGVISLSLEYTPRSGYNFAIVIVQRAPLDTGSRFSQAGRQLNYESISPIADNSATLTFFDFSPKFKSLLMAVNEIKH